MDRVVMKIVICGRDYIEVFAWLRNYLDSFSRSATRQRTGDKTNEAQQKYNDRRSSDWCRYLIKTNFSSGRDLFVTLTFRRGESPDTYEGLLYVMKKYLKRVECDSAGIVLRWLFVVELTKQGTYHVHLFVNGEVPRNVLREKWTAGGIHVRTIGQQTVDLDKIAGYVQKSPVGKHGFHYSKKTLEMPVIEIDEKLMESSLFKSLAYQSQFEHTDVAVVMEQKFPGYRMIIRRDYDSPYGSPRPCGWFDEYLRSPYMHVELERIRDDAERERQYERLAKQTACITPSRRMGRDDSYWQRMADERMELRREEQKEKLRENLMRPTTRIAQTGSVTGLVALPA